MGDDPRCSPQPLPEWIPTVLPAGWQELDTGPILAVRNRNYGRAYVKHGTTRVVVGCAQYADGKRWLHVSVSRRNQEIPSWMLMSEVKDLFIGPERTAIQVHPPRSKHVSIHPGVLHLWCCLDDANLLPDFTAGGDTI